MDSIANLLTKIRNAHHAHQSIVMVSHSKMKEKIVKILEKEKFIEEAGVIKTGKFPELKIKLWEDRELELKKISKPGQKIYVKNPNIKKVKNGLGMSIFSTSQGLMTGAEARKKKLGGELICTVS